VRSCHQPHARATGASRRTADSRLELFFLVGKRNRVEFALCATQVPPFQADVPAQGSIAVDDSHRHRTRISGPARPARYREINGPRGSEPYYHSQTTVAAADYCKTDQINPVVLLALQLAESRIAPQKRTCLSVPRPLPVLSQPLRRTWCVYPSGTAPCCRDSIDLQIARRITGTTSTSARVD